MGLDLKQQADNVPVHLKPEEVRLFVSRFQNIDQDAKGFITVNDLRRHMKVCGLGVP